MYFAMVQVCGRLAREQAQMFFEHSFRPLRIAKLGDSAGFLTGYYEPIGQADKSGHVSKAYSSRRRRANAILSVCVMQL